MSFASKAAKSNVIFIQPCFAGLNLVLILYNFLYLDERSILLEIFVAVVGVAGLDLERSLMTILASSTRQSARLLR